MRARTKILIPTLSSSEFENFDRFASILMRVKKKTANPKKKAATKPKKRVSAKAKH